VADVENVEAAVGEDEAAAFAAQAVGLGGKFGHGEEHDFIRGCEAG